MKIQYDKDFEKVMNELQANFGWSNIDELPDSYKDLLNDTIKAVKNCSIPDVINRREQLKAFADYVQGRMWEGEDKDLSEFIEEFLSL